MELQEPKLFIQSPPFYYLEVLEEVGEVEEFEEVEEVKESPNKENSTYEESTSVYEIARSEKVDKIHNEIILRQLNYFSQPVYCNRNYVFHLEDGEKVVGKIQEVEGASVKVKSNNDLVLIDGNEIMAITISKTLD